MDEIPSQWQENKKPEESPAWVVFFGILTALIMLVVILGLLNQFMGWAFDWKVTF